MHIMYSIHVYVYIKQYNIYFYQALYIHIYVKHYIYIYNVHTHINLLFLMFCKYHRVRQFSMYCSDRHIATMCRLLYAIVIYMYIYKHNENFIYIYIYMCVCVCVCVRA